MIIISLEVVNFCQLTSLDAAFPYITSSILHRLDTGVEIWQAAGILLDLSLFLLPHHHHNHNHNQAAAAAFLPLSFTTTTAAAAAQSTLIRDMPSSIIGYLKMIQSRIEEVLVWATPNSSIYQRMLMPPLSSSQQKQQFSSSSSSLSTTRNSHDRNAQLLSSFLQALANTAEKRSEASSLSLYNTFPVLRSTIQDLDKKIKAAVLHIIVNHLDMLFVAQHLMILVACASFYVLKNHNDIRYNIYPFPPSSAAVPTFQQMISCLTSSLPGLSPSDFKDITVYPNQYQNTNNGNKRRTTTEKMNCKEFYNTLFVQLAEQWDPKEVFGEYLMKTMDCPLINHNNSNNGGGGKPKVRKPLGRVDGNR
jgi:hypothetical protein